MHLNSYLNNRPVILQEEQLDEQNSQLINYKWLTNSQTVTTILNFKSIWEQQTHPSQCMKHFWKINTNSM